MRIKYISCLIMALAVSGCLPFHHNADKNIISDDIFRYENLYFDLNKNEDSFIPGYINLVKNCSDKDLYCYSSAGGTAFVAFVLPKSCRDFERRSMWQKDGLTTRIVSRLEDPVDGKDIFLLKTIGLLNRRPSDRAGVRPSSSRNDRRSLSGGYLYRPDTGIVAILWSPTADVPLEASRGLPAATARGVAMFRADRRDHVLATCTRGW